MFFDPLRAPPHGLEVLVAAIGACPGHPGLVAAMMTLQMIAPRAGPMQHSIGGAARAVADPPARRAIQHWRIASPIKKNKRLLAALKAFANSSHKMRRKPLLHGKTSGIDQAHLGQFNLAR